MMETPPIHPAPPPNPPQSQPHRRQGEWPKSLYLFYSHYLSAIYTGSFYKIDLPDPASEPDFIPEPESEPEPIPICPTLVFPKSGRFATLMKCARMGAKVYFVGGQVTCEDATLEEIFPRDVYVLYLAAPTSVPTKLSARLNAGKPDPLVFVAENKVFVLGSWNAALSSFNSFRNVGAREILEMRNNCMKGKLFECFDPNVGKWEVLVEPPEEHHHNSWDGYVVLETHRLVVLIGYQSSTSRTVQLLYDLSTGQWSPLSQSALRFWHDFEFITPTCVAMGKCGEYGYRYALYGVNNSKLPVKSKFDLEFNKEVCEYEYKYNDEDEESTIQIVNKSNGIPIDDVRYAFLDPYHFSEIKLLHLGDGYFCHVVAGPKYIPDTPNLWGYIPTDPCSRGINVVVFKEITNYDCDSFKAIALYSKTFVINTTPSYSQGMLVNAFVVSHDQQHRMKKKMKRKMRRNKSREEIVKGNIC